MDRFETKRSNSEQIVNRLPSTGTRDPKTDTVDAYLLYASTRDSAN